MNRTGRLRLQALGIEDALNLIDRIAIETGWTSDEIKGPSRVANLAWVRHLAMAAVRRASDLSLSQIGAVFGLRHHTSVLHGIRRAEDAAKVDPAVDDLLAEWGSRSAF